ncbi:MAG: hypothetical protein KDB22_06235 [Planctomycetales bacterium]|nr:hypothetical protein [Planctomycetales bacterium]
MNPPVQRKAQRFVPRIAAVVILLCPGIAVAQLGQLQTLDYPGFPVTRLVPTNASILLCGGHNVASCDPQSFAIESLVELSDERIAVAAIIGDKLIVAGTRDHDAGFAAAFPFNSTTRWWTAKVPAPVTCMQLTNDGILLGDEAGELHWLSPDDGTLLRSNGLHAKMVTALSVIDDRLCASADWGGKIQIFDHRDGNVVVDFQQHRDRVVELLVDSSGSPRRLYSAGRDGTVRLWYPEQGRLVRFVQLEHPVTSIASSDDGQLWVATSDAKLHLVDMNSAKLLSTMESTLDYVHCTASFGGRLFLSNGRSTLKHN